MTSEESGDANLSGTKARHRLVLMTLTEALRAGKAWALENLGITVLVLLSALGIATFLLGWALRPPAAAPTKIPNSPQLAINVLKVNLKDLVVDSTLIQTKAPGALLKIDAYGSLAAKRMPVAWSMGVQGFSGKFCTPKADRGNSRIVPIGYRDYMVFGTSKIPAAPSQGSLLTVHLCWKRGSPLMVSGSNFSAALPRILVPDQVGALTNVLQLSGTSLSGYSPSGGAAPEAVGPRSWAWTSALSGDFGSLAATEMPIFGSSSSGIQRENHNAFYSGVLFGVAGGAALSVLPALPGVIDRRKARRRAAEEKSGSATGTACSGTSGQASS
jgi:hypothetical protein